MKQVIFASFIGLIIPLGVAAYTNEQQDILDRYDEALLESGVPCFAYEYALNIETNEIGLDRSRSPEEELSFGVDALNIYMATDMPEQQLADLIEARSVLLRPAAQQVARLYKDRVPLDDPLYAPAREGSAPCGDMFDVLGERTRWAVENDLHPIR